VWKKLRRGMARNFDNSCNGKLAKLVSPPYVHVIIQKPRNAKILGVPFSPSLLHT